MTNSKLPMQTILARLRAKNRVCVTKSIKNAVTDDESLFPSANLCNNFGFQAFNLCDGFRYFLVS